MKPPSAGDLFQDREFGCWATARRPVLRRCRAQELHEQSNEVHLPSDPEPEVQITPES